MRCSAAVETLVRHAGWDGDVYIVYENEACFDANRIIQESGIRRERLHLVKFTPALTPSLRAENPAESDSIVDPMIEHLYIPNIRTEWRVKSRIFDIVTDPKIKIVASVDCDTLFAIEGCASALVSKAVDWKPTDAQIKFTSLESHSVGNTTHVKYEFLIINSFL
jgi:hypothetical protein